MPVIDFCIFSGLIVLASFLSVVVRSLLYAVFFQAQAIIAVAGILAELNASFAGFALTATATAALLAFVIFAMIVSDAFDSGDRLPPKAAKASLLFFVLTGAETAWLVFKPYRAADEAFSAVSLFDGTLFSSYGVCVAVFGTIVLSCLAGVTTLTTTEKGEE